MNQIDEDVECGSKDLGFNDKSEKTEIFLFSVSQRAFLGMKPPFNACKSIHIGDLAQNSQSEKEPWLAAGFIP